VRAAMATSLILALSVPTAPVVARRAPPAQAAGCADRVTARGVERCVVYSAGYAHVDRSAVRVGREDELGLRPVHRAAAVQPLCVQERPPAQRGCARDQDHGRQEKGGDQTQGAGQQPPEHGAAGLCPEEHNPVDAQPRPRARTQAGRKSCSAALMLARTASQALRARSNTTRITSALRTSASASRAAA
jgi:hypothetical protein